MNYTQAKRSFIDALLSGNIEHEARDNIEEKNWLKTGKITKEEVAVLLKACRGNQHSKSPHHDASGIEVHTFKPEKTNKDGVRVEWYIKGYFLDEKNFYISVHPS